jgi:DNA-binding response OmpR family regulator
MSKRVLVVEENEMTMSIYKLIFEKYIPDVEVECINNANDGLERVTRNNFDLLIVDYNLKHKDINGVDIARLAYPLGKPIMLASCHKIIPRMLLWCRYWDMCHRVKFIDKPFKMKEMVKSIKEQLKIDCIPLDVMFHKLVD